MAFPSPARLHRTIQLAFVLFSRGPRGNSTAMPRGSTGRGPSCPARPQPKPSCRSVPCSGSSVFSSATAFDPVHPAGLTVLLVALASALLCRRGFCGFLCPVGWLSGVLSRFGERNGLRCEPGKRVEWLLTLPNT
ncbi:MAG: 4Fe-4S binding protein [Bilophila sp.]